MTSPLTRMVVAPLLCLIAAAGCGGDTASGPTIPASRTGGIEGPAGTRPEFIVYPVEMTADGTIEPLGHLAPPGHTIPTDHVYFYPINYDKAQFGRDSVVRKVFAPATGAVWFMLKPVGTDTKVEITVTKDFGYYLDHINPRDGLKVGDIVHAGDVIGTTNPGGAIDLGAYDLATPRLPGLINATRYGEETLHCVDPFKYFVEPMRSYLYSRQRRVATAPPEARIDFDMAGRLAGNWFDSSLPVTTTASMGPDGWPKQLAFVPDNQDPRAVRVSIGGTVATQGIWTIPADAPRPESVSVASGKVSYRLMYTVSTDVQWGLMLVEMLADDRVKVEVFEGNQAKTAEFDARAVVYIR